MKKEKSFHEPLFHIVKRDRIPFWKSALIRVLAVIASLLFCMLFSYVFAGVDPVKLITSFVEGNFGSSLRFWKMAKELAILLGVALALTPAFMMRFWNIGGEGQILVGALGSIACVVWFGGRLPEPLLLLVMLVVSLLAGAVWAVVPAVFKALWNANETLFTLMMNYIAIELVRYMLFIWEPRDNTMDMKSDGYLNFFPKFDYGSEATVFIIVLLIAALMYVYLKYSKQGYEISVVGQSENTARYIGINVKKVVVRTMSLSGMLCGFVGFLIVSVFDHSINVNTAGGVGFTAIMVSWLASFNSLIMILTAFIVAFLNIGAAQLVTDLSNTQVDTFLNRSVGEDAINGISPDFPSVIVGIILLFIVGCEFFIKYQIKFRNAKRRKEEKK